MTILHHVPLRVWFTTGVVALAALIWFVGGLMHAAKFGDEKSDRATRERDLREQLDRRNREYFDRMPLISANNKQEE